MMSRMIPWIALMACSLAFVHSPTPALARSQMGAELHELFLDPPDPSKGAAKNTFVFWIQGDTDHFVISGLDSPPDEGLVRGDKIDVERLERVARSCKACNVVILHDQRGSARWYTANRPWATYLRVFERGREVLERHVDEVDGTDPLLIASLLRFSTSVFPGSELHLIYRGHGFRVDYKPGSKKIASFDFSHPQNGYGMDAFARSISRARLGKPLASVTLAACGMSSLELATKLKGFTRYLVASEVDILETLDAGFRFDVLTQVADGMDARQVSYWVAHRLLEAFKRVTSDDGAIFESPVTWIDMDGIQALETQVERLSAAIGALPKEVRDEIDAIVLSHAHVAQNVSRRWLDQMRRKGKSQALIERLAPMVTAPSTDPRHVDLRLMLETLLHSSAKLELAPLVVELATTLSLYVFQLDASPYSEKGGLSVQFIGR